MGEQHLFGRIYGRLASDLDYWYAVGFLDKDLSSSRKIFLGHLRFNNSWLLDVEETSKTSHLGCTVHKNRSKIWASIIFLVRYMVD